MKIAEFVVILAISINFASANSIRFNGAAAGSMGNTVENPSMQSDEGTLALDGMSVDMSDLGVKIWDAHRCAPAECNTHCQKLGKAKGFCVGNYCQCPLRTSSVEYFKEDEDVEPRAVRRCTASACAQLCRRLGFRYSRCSGAWCICWR